MNQSLTDQKVAVRVRTVADYSTTYHAVIVHEDERGVTLRIPPGLGKPEIDRFFPWSSVISIDREVRA